MTTWFTSDLHFGHANIIQYSGRPFTDAEQMNAALIERWNAVVDHDDTVWVLGDVAMGRITDTLPLVGRLHGTKLLVAGNHDRCWDGNGPRSLEWVDRYVEAGFEAVVQGAVELTVGRHDVLACHFPYRGDSQDFDRYPEYRPIDDGGWLLHGHVHEQWRQRDRMINVGCDAWDCRPVAEATLIALIEAGPEDLGPLPGGVPVIDIDGDLIYDRDDFYEQIGDRLIPGVSWGHNLDAFNDVLRGGMGTPSGPYVIRWHQAATTRARLGDDFDVLIDIIRDHGPDGAEPGGVHLDLR